MNNSMNINEIKQELLFRYPFFGSRISQIEFIEDDTCYEYHGNPSAAATKKAIHYHPEFISNLTKEECTFIFAHEIFHIIFKHHERSKGKNPKLWNTAADAVVNANLKKDGLKLVEGGVDIPEAIHYSAEEYYEKLLKNQQENKNNNNNNQSEQNESQDNENSSNTDNENQNSSLKQFDVGHDTHSNWYDEEEENKLEQKENNSSNNEEEDNQIDEKKEFKENHKQYKENLENYRKSLVHKMLSAGKDTNETLRNIEIGEASNLLDWKNLLIEATKIQEDWSFLNATVEEGVVIPHLEEQPLPETEIVLDTSGSVSDQLLRNFLRECKTIIQTSKIRVGCFDTKFYGFQEIRTVEDIDNFPIVGKGGTDFDVAVNSFTGKAENKIIFTDGYADIPKKEINAIWIVYGNKKINPPGGRVIYISEEQLQELSFSQEQTNKIR